MMLRWTLDCGHAFVFPDLLSGASFEFGPAALSPDSLSCTVIFDGGVVEGCIINSSCDGDYDVLGGINGKPVLTFTGSACEPDGDGTTVALMVLP
jgi:hypothetical protein